MHIFVLSFGWSACFYTFYFVIFRPINWVRIIANINFLTKQLSLYKFNKYKKTLKRN